MGTLSTELAGIAGKIAGRPRVYADANVPAGLVAYMRSRLGWDVLFVIEDEDLRRARDTDHTAWRAAPQHCHLDRDYLDSDFPSSEGAGVLVVTAPDEPGLAKLLSRVDNVLFRRKRSAAHREHGQAEDRPMLPLEGRKLHAHPDWMAPDGGRRRKRRRRQRAETKD